MLRLLRDGVHGPNGEALTAPRVIRLGSAEPEAHPLVQQAVWDTQVGFRNVNICQNRSEIFVKFQKI